METHRIRRDMSVLSDQLGAPDVGLIPVNDALVLHAAEPVVIGTGLSMLDRNFRPSFSAVMNPADLRWRVLTHRDHTRGLFALLGRLARADRHNLPERRLHVSRAAGSAGPTEPAQP
jgi:hypothetical protein